MKSIHVFLILTIILFSSANITYCGENLYNNLNFIENKGQWESRIIFKTTLTNGAAFIEKNCITFYLSDYRRECKHDNLTPKNHNKSIFFEYQLILIYIPKYFLLHYLYS